MEARPEVRIDLAYEEGLHARVMAAGPLPAELETAMDNYASVEWLPAFETLPMLMEALEAEGLTPQVSGEAQAIRALGDSLSEQDDAIGRWLSGEDGPALPRLRSHLKLHQLRGAAFLAFRERGLLADPRQLTPIATAVGACEIVRARREGVRVLIISAESRFELWQQELRELTGGTATVVNGTKAQRLEAYEGPASYLLTTAEALVRDRTDLEASRPGLVVVDEVTRVWGLASKTLDALRRLEVERIFGLVHTDPVQDPEGLYGFLALLSPALAGPRPAWEGRYVDRSVKGQIRVTHEGELRGRIAPFVMRRELDSIPVEDRPTAREVRRVPLARAQRTAYDRAQRSLLTLLGKGTLTIPDQRRAEDLLAQMRELCDSPSMREDSTQESAKLIELRYLLEESSAARIVVFSRWEAVTREISDLLKQLKLNHVRHYRKLPIKRREGLLERFRDDPDVRVLVTTDTELHLSGLSADLLLHFDAPWDPGVVTWRRAQLLKDGGEEVALIADDTLEEALWSLPRPGTHEAHSIEEEEAGIPGVHLFGKHAPNLLRLKRLMGLDPIPTEVEEENPAIAEVIAGAIQAHRSGEAGGEAPAIAAEAGAALEAGTQEVAAADSSPVDAAATTAPLEHGGTATEAGAHPGAGETGRESEPAPEASAAAEESPETSSRSSHQEEPADATPETGEPARQAEDVASDPETSGFSSQRTEADMDGSEAGPCGGGPLEGVLLQLEIPLKAVNRLLAGLPIVGEPLSMVNATLWELLASRLRNR